MKIEVKLRRTKLNVLPCYQELHRGKEIDGKCHALICPVP